MDLDLASRTRNGTPDVLWLGLDVGTSSLKLGVFDRSGISVYAASKPTPAGAAPGQLNALDLWNATGKALSAAAGRVDMRRVAAIGITGMAESGCLIDGDGTPVTPMLLWHDRRGVRQASALRRKAGTVFSQISGQRLTSVRSIAKWKWLVEHGASRSARWCGAPEWIAMCLTGRWLTDSTLAVRTGVFDVLRDDYSAVLLKRSGAPRSLFPPSEGSPTRAGAVLPGVAQALGLNSSAIVVIAGHDDVVAAFGAGAAVGDLIDSAGTAEGLIRIVSRAPNPLETVSSGMALARYYIHGTWALLAGAGSTGALMQMVADRLGSTPALLDKLASAPRAYPDGTLHARLSKLTLPSVVIDPAVDDSEVWSCVLDSVCDRFEIAARRLQQMAGPPDRLMLIGGAAGSRQLARRKRERLELPIAFGPEHGASTKGAALLAQHALLTA